LFSIPIITLLPVVSCTRFEMVRLHIKRGDESQFLFDTTVAVNVGELTTDILALFNGRLKVSRICAEMQELANHGAMLPPDIIGLTDEQVAELKLVDEWVDKCEPSGGWVEQRDPIGRRNGRAPLGNMQAVLRDAVEVAKGLVNKKLVAENKPLTQKEVQEALNMLRGAVMIVYPMQLPPHDPIRMEFSNTEDLSGTQVRKTYHDRCEANITVPSCRHPLKSLSRSRLSYGSPVTKCWLKSS
jgi:cilia- and flagella-associated protein 298